MTARAYTRYGSRRMPRECGNMSQGATRGAARHTRANFSAGGEERQSRAGHVSSSMQIIHADDTGSSAVSNPFHFAYADGKPYVQIGTTCYAWTHQTEKLERQTLATLKKSPFNKLRMCVFPEAVSA